MMVRRRPVPEIATRVLLECGISLEHYGGDPLRLARIRDHPGVMKNQCGQTDLKALPAGANFQKWDPILCGDRFRLIADKPSKCRRANQQVRTTMES